MNIELAQKQLKGNDLKFFKRAIKHLQEFKIKTKFYRKKYINVNQQQTYGFYDLRLKTLNVALYNHEWFQVFIHEYCHFIQHIEGFDKLHNNTFDFKVKKYISKNTQKKLRESCKKSADIELDCEKRVVETIKYHKLNINKQKYIQESANVNVCNYYLISELNINVGINVLSLISHMMPKTLNVDHKKLVKKSINKWLDALSEYIKK